MCVDTYFRNRTLQAQDPQDTCTGRPLLSSSASGPLSTLQVLEPTDAETNQLLVIAARPGCDCVDELPRASGRTVTE